MYLGSVVFLPLCFCYFLVFLLSLGICNICRWGVILPLKGNGSTVFFVQFDQGAWGSNSFFLGFNCKTCRLGGGGAGRARQDSSDVWGWEVIQARWGAACLGVSRAPRENGWVPLGITLKWCQRLKKSLNKRAPQKLFFR